MISRAWATRSTIASGSSDPHREDSPATTPNPYDAVPYAVNAFPQTTPDRLGVIGRLFGVGSAPPANCHVLELGCASGGNLIPMAVNHPGSRFVGVDLSERQVAEGQAVIRELGLANIELKHLSIMDVGAELGAFDYILAHGVYSWVPPEVQAKILKICRDRLTAAGIGYISYNTFPGWHARGAIREMLWYHTEHLRDPAQRVKQGRALLAFLAKTVPANGTGYSTLICQELLLLLRTPDTYLLHEHLEEYNEPLYFHQFAGRVMEAGLQYLGEAQISAMVASRFGAGAEKTLRAISPDLLHMEQYMDFLRNRMFRQSLVCKAEVTVNHALSAEAVEDFYVGTAAKAESATPDLGSAGAEVFALPPPLVKLKLTTSDPLMKGAMVELAEAWPLSVKFGELLKGALERLNREGNAEDARQLAARLLNGYASGLLEFGLTRPTFVGHVSERPLASPYARLRGRIADRVNNLRLESVGLTEASRLVLAHLDGRHDREALITLVAQWLEKQPTTEKAEPAQERATHYVEHILPVMANSALLVG